MKLCTPNRERAVARALIDDATQAIPSDADLWPTIRARLEARSAAVTRTAPASLPPAPRRWLCWPRLDWIGRAVVAAALLCTVSTAGGAIVATSPPVSAALRQAVASAATFIGLSVDVSDSGARTGHFAIKPAAPFQVAQLAPVPNGLSNPIVTYIPASTPGTPSSQAVSISKASDTTDVRPMISRLSATGVATLWLHFAASAPGTGYLDIVERAADPGETLPAGDAVTVGGVPATVSQDGADTVVALDHDGTVVTLRTNLGRAAALNVAGLLSWQ